MREVVRLENDSHFLSERKTFTICKSEDLGVVEDGIEILDPVGVNGTVENDGIPLILLSRGAAPKFDENTFRPVGGTRVEAPEQAGRFHGLGVAFLNPRDAVGGHRGGDDVDRSRLAGSGRADAAEAVADRPLVEQHERAVDQEIERLLRLIVL